MLNHKLDTKREKVRGILLAVLLWVAVVSAVGAVAYFMGLFEV